MNKLKNISVEEMVTLNGGINYQDPPHFMTNAPHGGTVNLGDAIDWLERGKFVWDIAKKAWKYIK